MSLPTGFGKSVCFQSIPFVMDHMYLGSQSASDVENTSSAFINHEQEDWSGS